MLNSGTDRVTPIQSMWPLVCSEIGLSYEQEEKLRTYQRLTLQNHETWLHRHTAFASGKAMESAHDAAQAIALRLGQRERSVFSGILSEEQQLKFQAWAEQNRNRIKAGTKNLPGVPVVDGGKYKTSDSEHIAGNLYVLNHQLQSVLKKIPQAPPLVTGIALKKLSRRPSFESLGCLGDGKNIEGFGLTRDSSFASSGSLKRSASEMSIDDSEEKNQIPAISPPEAQADATPLVDKVLGHLKPIIPPPPTPSVVTSVPISIPAPTPVASITSQRSQNRRNHHQKASVQHYHHQPSMAPMQVQHQMRYVASAPVFPQNPASPRGASPGAQQQQSHHSRSSSFLPPHLNVVPEEMWPADAATDDFLMSLVDEEDWAIGEGVDMEMLPNH